MKIFISIASFLDPTLTRTIRSALDKADNPEALVFGLGLQYWEDPDLSEFPEKQIRKLSWRPDARPGLVKIRYEISRLLEDEDYFLQIDSHMIFHAGWDTDLISKTQEIQRLSGTYKVIVFPLGIYPDGAMTSRFVLSLPEHGDGRIIINSIPENGKAFPESEIEKISYMRVGQTFFDARFIKEVGLDPRSHYTQEQAYLGFRAYITGWDVYQYHKDLMTHNDADYVAAVDQEEAKSWGTQEEIPNSEEDMSLAYIYNCGPYALPNAERTPMEYWSFNGCLEEFVNAKKILDELGHAC